MAENFEEEANYKVREITNFISSEILNSSNSKADIKIKRRLLKINVGLAKIHEISNEIQSLSLYPFEDIKEIVDSSAKLSEMLKMNDIMQNINESVKKTKDSIQILEFLIQPSSLYLMKIKNTLSINFEDLSIYFALGPLKVPLISIKKLEAHECKDIYVKIPLGTIFCKPQNDSPILNINDQIIYETEAPKIEIYDTEILLCEHDFYPIQIVKSSITEDGKYRLGLINNTLMPIKFFIINKTKGTIISEESLNSRSFSNAYIQKDSKDIVFISAFDHSISNYIS